MTGSDRKAAGQAAGEGEVIALIKAALTIADDIGLTNVGLRLDQALIELTGEGSAPNLDDGSLDEPAPGAGFHSPGTGDNGETAQLG